MTAHSDPKVLGYCIVNTGEVSSDTLKRYAQQDSYLVVNDRKKVEGAGYRVIEDDFVIIEEGVVRHDPDKLAKLILGLIEEI